MEEINANWLRKRLENNRGLQAELAKTTGISPDKISKILSGKRRVQANEIPAIAKFFDREPQPTNANQDQILKELLSVWSELTQQERDFLLSSAKGLHAHHQAEDP